MDFCRTRARGIAERQRRVLEQRCQHAFSREEAAARHEIASARVFAMNRMGKEFLAGLMILRCSDGIRRADDDRETQEQLNRLAAVAAASRPRRRRAVKDHGDGDGGAAGKRLLPPLLRKGRASGGDARSRVERVHRSRAAQAESIYLHHPAARNRCVAALRRAHYHQPMLALATADATTCGAVAPGDALELMRPLPPYELRLVAVREASERKDLVAAEAEDRALLTRHRSDATRELSGWLARGPQRAPALPRPPGLAATGRVDEPRAVLMSACEQGKEKRPKVGCKVVETAKTTTTTTTTEVAATEAATAALQGAFRQALARRAVREKKCRREQQQQQLTDGRGGSEVVAGASEEE